MISEDPFVNFLVYAAAFFIAALITRAIFSIGVIVQNLKFQNELLKKQNELIIQSVSLSKLNLFKQVHKIQIQNLESGEITVVEVAEWIEKYNDGSKYKVTNVE